MSCFSQAPGGDQTDGAGPDDPVHRRRDGHHATGSGVPPARRLRLRDRRRRVLLRRRHQPLDDARDPRDLAQHRVRQRAPDAEPRARDLREHDPRHPVLDRLQEVPHGAPQVPGRRHVGRRHTVASRGEAVHVHRPQVRLADPTAGLLRLPPAPDQPEAGDASRGTKPGRTGGVRRRDLLHPGATIAALPQRGYVPRHGAPPRRGALHLGALRLQEGIRDVLVLRPA